MNIANKLGTCSKCLAIGSALILMGILAGRATAQSVVKVSGTQGNWQLTLNGQPYYIKGLDYGPDLKTTQSTTNAYVADLVGVCGALRCFEIWPIIQSFNEIGRAHV